MVQRMRNELKDNMLVPVADYKLRCSNPVTVMALIRITFFCSFCSHVM